MRTTATNRKIREILTAIQNKTLVPRPEFQRRLVWANKHKNAFIDTVLKEYPFPEIYIAAGEVDTLTAAGKELLVDGQQRVTTLYQYFTASPDLKLESRIPAYATLNETQKRSFLNYDVVVRDLGNVSIVEIKEVFRRINSTRYALNAMEIANARFEGEFKSFGDEVAQDAFFDRHRVFSANEVKRMQDTQYALTITATIIKAYFNRDDALEDFLSRYNDEFPEKESIRTGLMAVFAFIDSCGFPERFRVWNKADLFTLIVELYRALREKNLPLVAEATGTELVKFYRNVEARADTAAAHVDVEHYYLATVQASNDRVSRVTRGNIIEKLLQTAANGLALF